MSVVFLLEAFLAGGVKIRAIRCYDVVATISRGVEDRLVLAHQGECDGGSDASKGARVGPDVNMMPCACVCKARLHSS